MKLRINKQSVRIRIDQDDLNTLSSTGSIKEVLGNATLGQFSYTLTTSNDSDLGLHFNQNSIIVYIPEQFMSEWANSDRVGFDAKFNGVDVLVEKDFKCLTDRPNEDESRNFDNPRQHH